MDFLLSLLFGVIVGTAIYQLVIKPARKRRAAKAEEAEKERLLQTSRNEPYRPTLRNVDDKPATTPRKDDFSPWRVQEPHEVFAERYGARNLIPKDDIAEKLKEKTPLRPIPRSSDESAVSRHRNEPSGSYSAPNPGLFLVDGSAHHGFGSRHDDGYTDDRPAPSHEPTYTRDDSTPTSDTSTSHGDGGSHNDNSGWGGSDSGSSSSDGGGGGGGGGD